MSILKTTKMKTEEINKFEKVQSQLEGLLTEMTNLVKKSPDDPLNRFKLKIINEVLDDANNILGVIYRPLNFFEKFDEAELPTNSDVSFILSQYLSCFEKMRTDNIYSVKEYDGNKHFFEWFWLVENKKSKIKTAPSKKIK